MQATRDKPSRIARSFVENVSPFSLIQGEQVVSDSQKNGHYILVNCLREACQEKKCILFSLWILRIAFISDCMISWPLLTISYLMY